jgi:hypothetical protein
MHVKPLECLISNYNSVVITVPLKMQGKFNVDVRIVFAKNIRYYAKNWGYRV